MSIAVYLNVRVSIAQGLFICVYSCILMCECQYVCVRGSEGSQGRERREREIYERRERRKEKGGENKERDRKV